MDNEAKKFKIALIMATKPVSKKYVIRDCAGVDTSQGLIAFGEIVSLPVAEAAEIEIARPGAIELAK